MFGKSSAEQTLRRCGVCDRTESYSEGELIFFSYDKIFHWKSVAYSLESRDFYHNFVANYLHLLFVNEEVVLFLS